ncbi:DUF4156 domain-containing protein [Helicobacter sp. MIT 05-5293]|uniref:DUF4156 domain-containing protein n=1 Tax=Helicobacter sp. MIT 05-5293 TaxID=1548149 RepID=UPI00051D494B|nr:DUF4156 domain-containing protein [Helicobacter sp. MIT 05-5293]TLD80113.1 DUF4156 domain-containing protein [Helicobacter sp. MIT 05-5293]
MKIAYTKRLAQLSIILGSPLLFFGCLEEPEPQAPLYTPKALESQGRGITIAHSTPYNCKILGEVEGRDYVSGRRNPTRDKLQESARNELKNEAGEVAGENRRIMLRITKEETKCMVLFKNGIKQEITCKEPVIIGKDNIVGGALLSHSVKADVFDCGEK